MITISDHQAQAIDATVQRRKAGEPYAFIAGAAGTGKTSIAKQMAEMFEGRTVFCAPANKAASLLAAKGCPNATSFYDAFHRNPTHMGYDDPELIARKRELNDKKDRKQITNAERGELANLCKRQRDTNNFRPGGLKINPDHGNPGRADTFFIDEASMLDLQDVRNALAAANGAFIVFLGDPAQLPPASGKPSGLTKPHFFLEQPHRQALESPIYWLANHIRTHGNLPIESDSSADLYIGADAGERQLEADMVIVPTNRLRSLSNEFLRHQRGFLNKVSVGELLIRLDNDKQRQLYNGDFEILTEEHMCNETYKQYLTLKPVDLFGQSRHGYQLSRKIDFNLENDIVETIEQSRLSDMDTRKNHLSKKNAPIFAYGHAITCHKAQGSEWGNVCMHSYSFEDLPAEKYLYTGVTRARNKVSIITPTNLNVYKK
ncbi:ATP-dependent DNA helicase [Aureimonas altamirensis]|uniref:ATP-dependent DNA helicase n=1 Tax=Aureimonas altamirensis TaxID=370622 RepID=UPI00255576AF|nr:ATP-dependent RecD-like DNA helicase [Aureimonas altamirensis]